jgi:hypothetical protein
MPFRDEYLDECNRLEGRGNPSARQCLGCQSIEPSFRGEATLRCEDCWGGQLFCKTCCLEQHRTHPLHRIKVCNTIPLSFYCCLTIVGMTGVERPLLYLGIPPSSRTTNTIEPSTWPSMPVSKTGSQGFRGPTHEQNPPSDRQFLRLCARWRAPTAAHARVLVASDTSRATDLRYLQPAQTFSYHQSPVKDIWL